MAVTPLSRRAPVSSGLMFGVGHPNGNPVRLQTSDNPLVICSHHNVHRFGQRRSNSFIDRSACWRLAVATSGTWVSSTASAGWP